MQHNHAWGARRHPQLRGFRWSPYHASDHREATQNLLWGLTTEKGAPQTCQWDPQRPISGLLCLHLARWEYTWRIDLGIVLESGDPQLPLASKRCLGRGKGAMRHWASAYASQSQSVVQNAGLAKLRAVPTKRLMINLRGRLRLPSSRKLSVLASASTQKTSVVDRNQTATLSQQD
jgi:hypothetical protein